MINSVCIQNSEVTKESQVLKYIPLTNRVQVPYCKLRTAFFPLQFILEYGLHFGIMDLIKCMQGEVKFLLVLLFESMASQNIQLYQNLKRKKFINTEILAAPSNLAAKNVKSLGLITLYCGHDSERFDKQYYLSPGVLAKKFIFMVS